MMVAEYAVKLVGYYRSIKQSAFYYHQVTSTTNLIHQIRLEPSYTTHPDLYCVSKQLNSIARVKDFVNEVVFCTSKILRLYSEIFSFIQHKTVFF
jgi:hypothetical protein